MMEAGSEILQNYDIVSYLAKKGMKYISDQIFEDLDISSLTSAEEASVVWADVIEEGKLWEKLFKKNVIQSHTWKVIQNSLDIHMLGVLSNAGGDIIDHHEFKKACHLITSKLEEIKENWKSGAVIERKCNIVSPCKAYGDGFGWLFNTYRPTCNRTLALTSQWAVTAGEDLKITIRNRFNLDEIVGKLNIPISNDSGFRPLISTVVANERFIVACFYFHSEVCVWDVATLKLLFVLDGDLFDESEWDRLRSSLNKICLHEDSLLTMHGGGADVICTMYKFSTDLKAAPLISFQEMLSVKAVEAVYMDNTLISMHVCLNNVAFDPMELVDLNHRIYTRSASTFDTISDIDAKDVSKFHYQRGVIAVAGESGKKIWLLDPETEECLRIVDNSQASRNSHTVDLKIVRDKLLTCDNKGRVSIWDLEKMLNSDDEDSFLFCRTQEPKPPLYRSWGDCVFDGMFIEADEFQVGLIATFKPNEHSLYVIDFIGDWESEEKKE